ncbi:hypothetical protein, conserved in T. vivax [Trypanosoma vivax Y486]|uniref:Uncharacterized protein n=1 Tax=Trypanosoma vivax (strain Y486) TaxID=1055687 RepID=F9WTC2_TRYVY|nr:hypothetical protein, conserved in T. vivax [Trypanosoma vivax Y486]|eukprot:CCD20815.1 hypothetical protein, conserved in T. vivax [Trypanosoma vivax Y486]
MRCSFFLGGLFCAHAPCAPHLL